MEDADLLIENSIIISMDQNRSIFHGTIEIKGDRIIGIWPSSRTRSLHAKRKIDGSKMAVLPGFINAHNHLWGSLISNRPTAEGLKLDEFLKELWRVKGSLGRDEFYYGSQLTSVQNIMSGITTLVDHCYPCVNPSISESVIDAVRITGMRFIFARGIMTKGYPPICETSEKAFNECEGLAKKYYKSDMVKVLIAPVSFRQAELSDYKLAKEIADRYHTGVYTHIAETEAEIETIKKDYGRRPVELLNEIGFLGKSTTLVHSIYVQEDEIQLIRSSGASVAHCASNNMRLAKGAAPIAKMIDEGINICLGTDNPITAKQDFFTELYNLILFHSFVDRRPEIISPMKALEIATLGGARALGMENMIGSIEVGKKADLILIDMDKPHLKPLHDVAKALVFHASAADVDTVIINGKIIMENRNLITINIGKLLRHTTKLAEKFLTKIGESDK
ncbi:MAG: amidohydrolase [Nitrososphaerota archaeon]|jgi:5-methylthioadenosine/S-adenosylhomocysteine deaminase|nr:amidohydrolase [Nitrososphaerota archaeon]MDG7041329.1 amidohydrolase [Nitrososphaerota archaeon]MDG7045708.1 amidohydrolase [Nitrososphaerota archaeon]